VQRPDRPFNPDRPVNPDRPWNPDRPDRPVIGGGNDHIHIGDNNINNINNINNWGLNRPGGDYWSQNHDWADHWHDHCINDHYNNWYHGCWGGHWGNNWYAPIVWSGVGWGLGYATSSSWGYGPSYYNPYYDSAAAAPIYDYSQPVYVTSYEAPQTYADPAATTVPANTLPPQPQEPPENQQAMQLFDAGMAAFKAGNYGQALSSYDDALKLMPSDPVLHEVRALSLFALGRYKESAATLNALLASSPGMDWTSMSSLYGSVDDYTSQLRKLETYVKGHPEDPSAMFVLAYHYLVTGHNDSAVRALQAIVKLQPKDTTAQRMLAALAPPETLPATATPDSPPPQAPDAATPTPEGPQTDLVGKWLAKSDGATVELAIDDNSQFTWKVTPTGKPPVEVKGQVATTSDSLVLETKDQGSMAGQVKSAGPDKFSFALAGMPKSDAGLVFERIKN
jgi:tetratricopeptide (TPR) repeat protein